MAFDLISRELMLTFLGEVFPFVTIFHGTPSECLHKTPQGEGWEQGDAMMPLWGQRALEAMDGEMGANQHLMAFLDDIFHAKSATWKRWTRND